MLLDGFAGYERYERYVEPYSYEVRDRRVRIARGLQAVDGLTTSEAFDEPAQRYVEGEIDVEELRRLVDAYYDQKISRARNRNSEEADLVSARICAILESSGFTMSTVTLQTIHGQLFRGLMEDPFYEHNFRDYNIVKREFILARESVEYGEHSTLKQELDGIFEGFQPAPYHAEDPSAYAASVARLVTGIWQLHPFAGGNTRTTAVFLQKLLRSRGFKDVDNEVFVQHSLRFRNALVRASYSSDILGVQSDYTYINTFVECLLANEVDYPYRNRDMCVPQLFLSKGMLVPGRESDLIG